MGRQKEERKRKKRGEERPREREGEKRGQKWKRGAEKNRRTAAACHAGAAGPPVFSCWSSKSYERDTGRRRLMICL